MMMKEELMTKATSEVYVLLKIVDTGISDNGWSVEETEIMGVFTTRDAAVAMQAKWTAEPSRIECYVVDVD